MDSFQCQRCGACCKQTGFVYLKEGDAERLALHFGTGVYEFTGAYCLLLERRHLVLKKNQDEPCLFLTPDGCSVYRVRPSQCRDFPFQWKTERSMDYCEGLKAG
jgi:Fe-S-cluster containining protein